MICLMWLIEGTVLCNGSGGVGGGGVGQTEAAMTAAGGWRTGGRQNGVRVETVTKKDRADTDPSDPVEQ